MVCRDRAVATLAPSARANATSEFGCMPSHTEPLAYTGAELVTLPSVRSQSFSPVPPCTP